MSALIDPPNETVYRQESQDLEMMYAPIADEYAQLEMRIKERLETGVPIISQAAHYLINAGGKRIRPAILLSWAKILNAPMDLAIELSAVVEFIHSATLLHDDVVDEAQLRRGLDSGNVRFGNAVSVLVGDFLYSRAFQMMVRVDNMEVMKILSEATNTIAEGEVLQLLNIGNVALTREEYQRTIYCKTARLFEASAELAVVLAPDLSGPLREDYRMRAQQYGQHIGHAFQLSDDALDYSADAQALGKRVTQDLHEGKITLPLLMALEESSLAPHLKIAITNDTEEKYELAQKAIAEVGGIARTLQWAKTEASSALQAIEPLPAHPAKALLHNIAEFILARDF